MISNGAPAVGSAGYLVGADMIPSQLRHVGFDGQTEVGFDAGTGNFVSGSPIVAEGGVAYWVSRTGTLFVTDEGLSALRWSAPLGTGGSVVASPNFDCNRSGAGGVLYLATTNGRLTSILVDSSRLAATDWPKWQHDSQNSGNADFPLNAGCP